MQPTFPEVVERLDAVFEGRSWADLPDDVVGAMGLVVSCFVPVGEVDGCMHYKITPRNQPMTSPFAHNPSVPR